MSGKHWSTHGRLKSSYRTLMRKEDDRYVETERPGSNRPRRVKTYYKIFHNGKWKRPGDWR